MSIVGLEEAPEINFAGTSQYAPVVRHEYLA